MPLTTMFSPRPVAALDAAVRLESCRKYLADEREELARRAQHYTAAVGRSVADTAIKTESAEARRAHAALSEQRQVVARAADAVDAAERLHREAEAREKAAADAAAWAAVEAAARARVDAAEILTDLAAKLAKSRHAFQDAAADHAQKLAAALRFPPGLEPFNEFSAQVDAELGRTGATVDMRRAMGLVHVKALPDICRELEAMTRQLRAQAHKEPTE